MPRPWRIRFPGAKYHLTTRGNAREVIFHAQEDYARYLEQLRAALESDHVILYAYALLPNHTHLLVETPWANIQRFMQRLNTAYGMYRRYKRRRPGHCFQARYGARLVSGEDYLLRVTRYIHLNPVKVRGLMDVSPRERIEYLNAYPWSSYRGYVRGKDSEESVNYRWLDLMGRATVAGNRAAYRAYVESLVDGQDAVLKEAMTAGGYTIGDEKFRTQVEEDMKAVRVDKGVYGDIQWPRARERSVQDVVERVALCFGVAAEELRTQSRHARLAKKVALELCCEYCGQSQREIGRYFAYVGNGSVGKQRAALRALLRDDKAVQRRLDSLRDELAKP